MKYHFNKANLSRIVNSNLIPDERFQPLTESCPKDKVKYAEKIWPQIVDEIEVMEKKEKEDYNAFIALFGGLEIPQPLLALYEFEKWVGKENLSENFYLRAYNKTGLKTWSDNPDFLDSIIEFATANGSGASYAFWKTSNNLNDCPIVVFGDEGGHHIVAENILDLMHLLTFDIEVYADFDGTSYYKDEDEYEESDCAGEYRVWLKENYGLKPITTQEEIDEKVKRAQDRYQDVFEKWVGQFVD